MASVCFESDGTCAGAVATVAPPSANEGGLLYLMETRASQALLEITSVQQWTIFVFWPYVKHDYDFYEKDCFGQKLAAPPTTTEWIQEKRQANEAANVMPVEMLRQWARLGLRQVPSRRRCATDSSEGMPGPDAAAVYPAIRRSMWHR